MLSIQLRSEDMVKPIIKELLCYHSIWTKRQQPKHVMRIILMPKCKYKQKSGDDQKAATFAAAYRP